jgi:hypothetical protein
MTVRLSNLTARWVPGTAPNVALNMQVLDSGTDPTTSKFFNYSVNGVNQISGYANGRISANALSLRERININAGAIVMYANGMIVANGSLFITGNVNVSGIIVSGNAGVDLTGVFVIANAAFIVANTANVQSNQAFIQANAASLVANTGNLYSNLAFRAANAAFGVINLHNSTMTSMNTDIVAAFSRANTANATANFAFANSGTTVYLQQDFGTSSASLVDVTGLSIPVQTNKTYHYKVSAIVRANAGVATTVGFDFGLNFPTGAYPQGFKIWIPGSSSGSVEAYQATDAVGDHIGTVLGIVGAGIPIYVTMEGFVAMRTNAAGTIDARFDSETAGQGFVIQANSSFSYKVIS